MLAILPKARDWYENRVETTVWCREVIFLVRQTSTSDWLHRSQLFAGLRRRRTAGRMNAGVVGVKGEDALHITFDSRRGEIEGKPSCHTVAANAMTMGHRPSRLRLFVTGFPSTAVNQTPVIGTVCRTAGDEAAVRRISKDSSSLALLSMTKLWIALVAHARAPHQGDLARVPTDLLITEHCA